MTEPTKTGLNKTEPSETSAQSSVYSILYWLSVSAAALYYSSLRFIFNRDFPLATMQALIDGTAYRPFQYRILVPWLVGRIHDISGVSIGVLYQSVEALAALGVVLALRYLLAPHFKGKALDILSAGIMLVLPWNYLLPREIAIFIPADLPAVMFFAFLLALMSREKWSWYYPLFVLATFNRETTCFVTLIFLLVSWKRIPSKTMWLHIGAQFVLWVAIKYALAQTFADNPGSVFEIYGVAGDRTHLDSNLEFLFSPLRVLILLSSFGFLWVPVFAWRKRLDDHFIKQALLGLLFFLGAMLLIGNLNETRIFGEYAPLVYVGAALLLQKYFNQKVSSHGRKSVTG